MKLAIQEANKKNLRNQPEVANELKQVLYKYFLKHSLSQANIPMHPSKQKLKELYHRSPLVQLKHLVIMARTPSEKKIAGQKQKEIMSFIAGGEPFQKLILKYSEDPSAKLLGGNMDYMGRHNLTNALYVRAISLKKGLVSEPIKFQGGIHFIQVTDIKTV